MNTKTSYMKLLDQHKILTKKNVDNNKLKKIFAYAVVVKKLNSLSWKIQVSAKEINYLYIKGMSEFQEICSKEGLEVQYPLDFKPKELIELQNELDTISEQISKVTEKYYNILKMQI